MLPVSRISSRRRGWRHSFPFPAASRPSNSECVTPDFDLILAGGGLANGLIALRLAQLRPELRVAIVESGASIGGDHTWSSFGLDINEDQRRWTQPLFAHRWDCYSVRFPRHHRTLDVGYGTSNSERLAAAVTAALPPGHIITNVPVVALSPTSVTLADQRVLHCNAVIDGRGQKKTDALDLRWQKFLGQEVELAEDHGLKGPIIMDATIPQADGYRFVYTLPYGPRHVLIEDTYYSDGRDMAPDLLRRHIADYAAQQGWTIRQVIREETGILPLAVGGSITKFLDEGVPGVARVGLAAGLFHPVTGYSFPDAVRMADMIAALPAFDAATIHRATRDHAMRVWNSRGMYRVLNRMLFLAAHDEERRTILERFYEHPDDLVGRLYAADLKLNDWRRIFSGRPPIPPLRAVGTVLKYGLGLK
ncbi:lycopene cyclase [Sphingomonas sp. IBVSS1]|nr:lycopene cyclase [Sphingomonas sp. IBVSS1]